MTPERVPVVIVGAGPTGVTTATLLAQYGIDSVILDRWADVYNQPRAVHMDDEVCRIVTRLGVADEFTAISRPAHGLRLIDRRGRVLAEFSRGTNLGVHGFSQANMFDQPELEAVLRRNLKHYPGAHLRGNAEVTDVAADSTGRVRVSYRDRTTDIEHTIEADYVLGCDGANSLVRARIGTATQDLKFDQRWLVVDVATNTDLHQWDGVHQLCDPRRAGTYMRIGDTRYRWEFRLLPGESAADFQAAAALRPLIAPWVADVSDSELEVIRVTEYTFRAQLADRWRRGHIFLLGDAAHLTPPFVGQGMGAGLRDAMNLSWKLAAVLRGELPESSLDTYEQERKPHARAMIRLALGVGSAMTAGGSLGAAIRAVALPRLRLIPGIRRRIVDSRTPPLSSSEFVLRERRPRHLGGTLCPNPLLGDGSRLDSALGSGFALVTASVPAQVPAATVIVAKPGSELAAWLRRGRATAAIIRPDRTVMAAGHDVAALAAKTPLVLAGSASRRSAPGTH